MKKTRVFALLWACGLVLGANGMTVLATEQGAEIDGETAAKEEAEPKKESETSAYVSRIVSFTDGTGMRVTYDANASRQYVYEVKNGVLTGVKVKKSDEEGTLVLEANSFEGTVELQQPEEGEKYTSIAADLFGGNSHITYVKLPAGVTTIKAGSFKGCTALKSVYLPATVKTIEKEAFRDCTAMTQIAVPKSVASIGEGAFKGDTKLQKVYFRSGDSDELSIGANAFPGADEAEKLVIMAAKGSEAEVYATKNGLAFEEKEPEE